MSSSMFKVKGAKIRQWNSDLQWVLSKKGSCRKVEVTILHHRVDPGNIRQHFCKCKHAACLDEFDTLIMVEIPWCFTMLHLRQQFELCYCWPGTGQGAEDRS